MRCCRFKSRSYPGWNAAAEAMAALPTASGGGRHQGRGCRAASAGARSGAGRGARAAPAPRRGRAVVIDDDE
eukprot:6205267-Pleurochrysis_carterae.AAC.1